MSEPRPLRGVPGKLVVLLCVTSLAMLRGQVSVLTWHNDNARTGQNLRETILTPANVNSTTFGKLFVLAVDGKVDAQPLYVPALTIPGKGLHNVVFVETEHDSAYAFDADNGAPLWQVSLLASGESPSDNRGCDQVTPEIGITATPIIDPASGPHGTMYVLSMSKDGAGAYHHRLHALDLTTGAEEFGGPVAVQASYPGSGAENTFQAAVHKTRPGLMIVNGMVITSWGSHCDAGPYAGWVIAYDETNLSRVSVLNLTPNGSDGGIWMSGAGPAADPAGNLYLLMGNGTFDTTLTAGGFPIDGDYGNAFVKISTANRALAVSDYFTMLNTVSESNADADLGSGGGMVLPPLTDTMGHSRSLAVGAGKDGHIYVVDQADMGKFVSSANVIYQDMPNALPGGVWSSPAWFNGTLYYGSNGGRLAAFRFANGMFPPAPSSQSPTGFTYPGPIPSISANGVANAIVWAVENTSPAVLHAYQAGDLSQELYNSNQAAGGRDNFGVGNKFIVPTVVNGKVYVGTTNGVGVFGLLEGPSPVSVAPSSGTGASQTFSFVFSDPSGFAAIGAVQMIVNGGLTSAAGCYVQYMRSTNTLLLANDAGTAWLPSATPGQTGTLQNSQCAVNVAGFSATGSGNNLTVSMPVTFQPAFGGSKSILMDVIDSIADSGWQLRGTWTVPSDGPPLPTSVAPNSGTGANQTFSFVFSDPNGFAAMGAVQMIVNGALTSAGGCYVQFSRSTNTLLLANDAGTAWLAPATPGQAGTLQNSQCTVNVAGFSATGSGNNLTVNMPVSFQPAFGGGKSVFMDVTDSLADSGWLQRGSWTVPSDGSPSPTSVTPSSGSGLSQTFSFVFADPNGFAAIGSVQMVVNGALTSAAGCYVQFVRSTNILLLANDAGTAWLPPATPGQAGTLQNSQCTVNVAGFSASGSGNSLTVSMPVSFQPAFGGSKSIFMDVTDSLADSGWQLRGSWTVP